MTTTAFTLMFLPACLVVPAGLALGVVSELVIEGIGAALSPPEGAATGPRAGSSDPDIRPSKAEEGRDSAPIGPRGGRGASGRRDGLALLDALGGVGTAPWM